MRGVLIVGDCARHEHIGEALNGPSLPFTRDVNCIFCPIPSRRSIPQPTNYCSPSWVSLNFNVLRVRRSWTRQLSAAFGCVEFRRRSFPVTPTRRSGVDADIAGRVAVAADFRRFHSHGRDGQFLSSQAQTGDDSPNAGCSCALALPKARILDPFTTGVRHHKGSPAIDTEACSVLVRSQ